MDRGARWAAVHGVTILVSLMAQIVKNLSAIQETQVQSLGREDPLEKGKATHSSSLAWEIPWTEETGGLQFLGSQRVGPTTAACGGFLMVAGCFYNSPLKI